MDKDADADRDIIVFDGICNLCNAAVNFVIARDHGDSFRFSAMQSVTGQALLSAHGISSDKVDTFLLISNGCALNRSDAALAVARQLDGLWASLAVLRIVPKPVRDWIYSVVARNRYAWFGKRDHCMIPTPALREKFLT